MNETKLNGRDVRSGRFLPGNSAGPGRPRGSRNKLAEKFLTDVYRQWRKSGAQVLERVVRDDPTAFMKVVAHILPREIDSTLSMNVSLFSEIENFNEAFEFALRHIGANMPPLIEAAETGEETIDADDGNSAN
jgi:hypothetical protein